MATAAAIFVSKRLQAAALAMICIMAGQLVYSLAGGDEHPVAPGAVRVAIPNS